jgi:hypothetical protein
MDQQEPKAAHVEEEATTTTAEVELKQVPDTKPDTKPDKKAEYIKERNEDAVKCTQEFAGLLKKYGCYTEVGVTINTAGKVTGNVIIRPKI